MEYKFDETIVKKATCPNCGSDVTEVDGCTGLCYPCYVECRFYETSDSVLILAPRGRIFYSHNVTDEMSFCFDLLSEVGEYWKPTFKKLIDGAGVNRSTKETKDDIYDVWSKK